MGIFGLIGFIAIYDKEVLKALIEAEATVLGFFTLIVVYALGSLDNRIDRLDQHIFDIKLEDKKNWNYKIVETPMFDSLCRKKQEVEEAKRARLCSGLVRNRAIPCPLYA